MKKIGFLFLFLAIFSKSNGQVGISVSPPRIYFELNPGQSGVHMVKVTNPGTKNTLELAITLGDWEYDIMGDNVVQDPGVLKGSCASWLSFTPSYFSLKPGESKNIEVSLNTPLKLDANQKVHTALLYITQMNPTDDVDKNGASIKVSVRSAVKVYHRTLGPRVKAIEIQNLAFRKETKELEVLFENKGTVWTDGKILVDLMNQQTGKQTRLDMTAFYTLPGNKRKVLIPLPQDLAKGRYTATVLIDHEDQNNIEAAELGFSYE